MVTVFPWAVAAVVAVAGVVWLLGRRGRRDEQVGTWVANTGYLTASPAYRAWLARYRSLRVGAGLAVAMALAGTAVMLARPVHEEVRTDRMGTRDIVLCLDVSGSMIPYDAEIVQRFADMVDGFRGERIGLSVFNSSSRTVFPLTDDYAMVLDELTTAADALSFDIDSLEGPFVDYGKLTRLLDFLAGTQLLVDEASLIGDGLASCGLLFDEQASERSRSIILATDNELFGVPIYTLPEAVDLVTARQVTLYGLFPGDSPMAGTAEEAEYRDAVHGAGGLYYVTTDADAVPDIIDDVIAQQAVALDASPTVVRTDVAGPWYALAVAGVWLLVLTAWRSRE